MFKEFLLFLKEYKIVSLAMAFVMGVAATGLVNSLVKDIVMPILAPLFSAANWQDAVLHIGPIAIAYGSFLSQCINFAIIGFVVFIVAKKILREDQVMKK